MNMMSQFNQQQNFNPQQPMMNQPTSPHNPMMQTPIAPNNMGNNNNNMFPKDNANNMINPNQMNTQLPLTPTTQPNPGATNPNNGLDLIINNNPIYHTNLLKTILAQYTSGSITVDDVKELINIASMLQSSETDLKQQTEHSNKLNSLLEMSTKNEGNSAVQGGNGNGNGNAQVQQQNSGGNNNVYNPNMMSNYNDG